MIPHTVPNNPTKGPVEPTEARNVMWRSSPSISRPSVTSMTRSIRWARPAFWATSAIPLAAERRHSRMAAIKIDAIGLVGRSLIRSYRSSSDPPDQKASSNSSAWAQKPPHAKNFLEDNRPTPERGQDEHDHDNLHNDVSLQKQPPDRKIRADRTHKRRRGDC